MPAITLTTVLLVLGALAALALLANALLLLLARRYRPERTPDEIYRTTTDDGWVLEIARYKAAPRPEGAPKLPPVICCHGLGANAISLDMAEEVSIPRTLRARGFDTWLLDLRGCGNSSKPPRGRGRYEYSFDDLAARDVKAAIELVKRETGAQRVAWVGHSMGGAVLYAHAEIHGDQDIQAAAVIASPSGFDEKRLVTKFSPLAPFLPLPGIHHELPARIASPLAASPFYGRLPLVSILINHRNADDRYVKIGLASAMANPSARLMKQFARWSLTGKLSSEDGKRVYFQNLDKVRVPWLAIAGAGDELVPAANVRAGFDKLGSRDKEWILLGAEHGHAADYGHCDLVLGPRCREEVFEPIARFLARYPLAPAVPAAVGPEVGAPATAAAPAPAAAPATAPSTARA